ncbi:hypothetical protein BDV38DRAFT_249224 [Aspergillus pseudotamarii]|uniref:Uncharacterized protein n=1 Tax=Aspergillus pseudotamarii TaxID=132259 RepID=A0A5N6SPC9_ASPPS|nr:uncharacterized protein BDV38DRAFT_249224 [Aspergillus pseudotamarii]KAE8136542.1 hypothetical protein BDV38DRAFT_249224 [Aspergillus pseudotamarii]
MNCWILNWAATMKPLTGLCFRAPPSFRHFVLSHVRRSFVDYDLLKTRPTKTWHDLARYTREKLTAQNTR